MSLGLSQEQPPQETEQSLKEYLKRRFIDIAVALQDSPVFQPRKTMPYKPQIGNVHYFKSPLTHNYDPEILFEGYWGLTSNGWVYFGYDKSTLAAYGGIHTSTPTAGADINATWQTVPFDSAVLLNPRGVNQDFANNELGFLTDGVYNFSFDASFQHDEDTAGRAMQVRLNNVTDGIFSLPFTVGTGRNTSVTTFGISTLFEVSGVATIQNIQAEIHSVSDIYTDIIALNTVMSASKVSQPNF